MWGDVGVSQHQQFGLKGSLTLFIGLKMSKSSLLAPTLYHHPGIQTPAHNNLLHTTRTPQGSFLFVYILLLILAHKLH